MLHQTRVIKIAQFNTAVEIYSRPPLLLW